MTATEVAVGFAFLVVSICAGLTVSSAYAEVRRKNKEIAAKDKTIEALLNRLQSEDLHTFLALQQTVAPVAPDSGNYVGMSDSEELQRLGKSQGLGYEIHDDSEFADTLTELGIDTEFLIQRSDG